VVLNFAYGFYLTLKRHEHYSSINLWAVVLLCVTFLHDFLLSLNWIDSINLSFASTSFYAFLIMVQQSKSYAYHSDRIEKLNNNLLELNSSLDQKVKERTVQLSELNEKLELQAQIDALTGAFNRRALNTEIQRQFNETSQQHNAVLAFAMLDVDYFKNYNDYYGHLKGDEILQQLVQVIQSNLPEHAYLARYGGEEFAVIIRNMPVVVVEQTLQHVLHIIRQQQFEHLNRGDHKQYVTISIGAAYMDRKHQYHDIHALMKAADQQLYLAKNAGRDQLKI
jgi:diguanylate cyclase (GGDEF)-like protein